MGLKIDAHVTPPLTKLHMSPNSTKIIESLKS